MEGFRVWQHLSGGHVPVMNKLIPPAASEPAVVRRDCHVVHFLPMPNVRLDGGTLRRPGID